MKVKHLIAKLQTMSPEADVFGLHEAGIFQLDIAWECRTGQCLIAADGDGFWNSNALPKTTQVLNVVTEDKSDEGEGRPHKAFIATAPPGEYVELYSFPDDEDEK